MVRTSQAHLRPSTCYRRLRTLRRNSSSFDDAILVRGVETGELCTEALSVHTIHGVVAAGLPALTEVDFELVGHGVLPLLDSYSMAAHGGKVKVLGALVTLVNKGLGQYARTALVPYFICLYLR